MYSFFYLCVVQKLGAAIPYNSSIKQGEYEVEGDGAPRDKMVHPGPEVCLQRQLSSKRETKINGTDVAILRFVLMDIHPLPLG